MEPGAIVLYGIAVVFLGFMIIAAGMLPSTVRETPGSPKASVHGGGVIFIGPIPVVFGTDKNTALTAAAAGLILMAAYYFFLRR